jgi:hypothetical protein
MSKLLIHLATGPENPSRGALALLLARTAVDEGQDAQKLVELALWADSTLTY